VSATWPFTEESAEYRAIRERFLLDGPFRGGDYITAMHRDILGLLRVAGRPLSVRELYELFASIERTWLDFSRGGIQRALTIIEAKGLVERIRVERVKTTDPAYLWRVPHNVARAEATVPVSRKLRGVGPKTGRARKRRESYKRDPQRCVLCGATFRALYRRPYCSDTCEGFHRGGLLSAEQRRVFDEVLAEQAIEKRRAEHGWGERPSGSRSPGFCYSLDAPWGHHDSDESLGDLLTSREGFTSMSEIEQLMVSNGEDARSLANRHRVRLVRGRDEVESERAA
jgi:hypothetical protein